MKIKRWRDWSVRGKLSAGIGIMLASGISGLTCGTIYSKEIGTFFNNCCGGDTTMTIAFWACVALVLLLSVPFLIWLYFHKKGKRKKELQEAQTRAAALQEEYLKKVIQKEEQRELSKKEIKELCESAT